MEEIEHPFPGEEKDDEEKKSDEEKDDEEKEQDTVVEAVHEEEVEIKPDEPKSPLPNVLEEIEEKVDDLPADSGPFPVSSSSGSDGAESISGPSTAENSQSLPARAPSATTTATVVESESQAENEPENEPESPEIIPNKMLVGGRASIPDELQPDQLEKLQSLKESNA